MNLQSLLPKRYKRQAFISILFFLLLYSVSEAPSLYALLSAMFLMVAYIIKTLNNQKKSLIIHLLSMGLIFIFLAYNSNYEYGVVKFNSVLYPISLQDYIIFSVSLVFARLFAQTAPKVFLRSLEIFASILSVYIAIETREWFVNDAYPVFSNTNWLGTLIVSIFLINIHTLFKSCSHFLEKLRGSSRLSLMLSLFIIILGYFTACIFNFLLLLETGSRSSAVATIASLLIYFLFYISKLPQRVFKSTLKIYLISLASVTTAIFVLLPVMRDTRFYVRISQMLSTSQIVDSHRVEIYSCHLKLFSNNIFLGVGMGKAAPLCEEQIYGDASGGMNHAHNFLLQVAVDHGVFALLILLCAIAFYLVSFFLFFAKSKSTHSEIYELTFVIYISVFALALASLFQSSIYHVPFLQIWLGFLMGASLAISKYKPDFSNDS